MAHIYAVNVNDAFSRVVGDIHHNKLPIIKTSSRNGDVLQITEPVTITYAKPTQRVLFNQARDSNPAFSLMESLWMLQGRNDLAPIQYYITDFEKFSDDGETLNAAYGYRWRYVQAGQTEVVERSTHDELRRSIRTDQLKLIIHHLKVKPDSRRAVLSMWNVEDDLLKIGGFHAAKIGDDLWEVDPGSKDVCCNLSATFQIVNGKLDMTVFNRSNDAILGSLGANLVHFSFLLEYMAAHIGVPVGFYNQVSTNLHVYTWNWKPEEWLDEHPHTTHCSYNNIEHFPLVKDPKQFDIELAHFNEHWLGKDLTNVAPFKAIPAYQEPFFADVALPMAIAFHQHKKREYESALSWCSKIKAEDWRWVSTKWVEKRMKKWNDRNPYSAKILGEV